MQFSNNAEGSTKHLEIPRQVMSRNSQITAISFYISDDQLKPFKLDLDSILPVINSA
jgi:hypothetical protein